VNVTRKKLLALMLAPMLGLAAFLAPGLASAATSTSPVHHAAFFACVDHNGSGQATAVTGHPVTCPAGSILAEGDRGTTGPAGPAGKDGASGVVSVTTATGSTAIAHVGGSWSAGHAVVKTIPLKAGTYLITLTGDFYKTVTTTATPVLQIQLNGASTQLTGYTGAFPYNAAEAVGTGTDGTPNGLEQTATAVGTVTLATAGDVEIDVFGYNPDRSAAGSGDFAVNATASFTALQAAS
jgi:hypothetical protein